MKFEAAKKVIIIIDIILEWVSYVRRTAFFSLSCFLVIMAEKADAQRGTKNINVKRLYQTCHSIDTFAFPMVMLIIISYFVVVIVCVDCVVPFCKKGHKHGHFIRRNKHTCLLLASMAAPTHYACAHFNLLLFFFLCRCVLQFLIFFFSFFAYKRISFGVIVVVVFVVEWWLSCFKFAGTDRMNNENNGIHLVYTNDEKYKWKKMINK